MSNPRMYVKANETFEQARVRWLCKFQDYQDFKFMRTIVRYDERARAYPMNVKNKHFYRAFHKVELHFIAEVLK